MTEMDERKEGRICWEQVQTALQLLADEGKTRRGRTHCNHSTQKQRQTDEESEASSPIQ